MNKPYKSRSLFLSMLSVLLCMGSIAHATKKEPALTKIDKIKQWIGSNIFENGNISKNNYFYKKFFKTDPKYMHHVNEKQKQEERLTDPKYMDHVNKEQEERLKTRAQNYQRLEALKIEVFPLMKARNDLMVNKGLHNAELAPLSEKIAKISQKMRVLETELLQDLQEENKQRLLSIVGTFSDPNFMPFTSITSNRPNEGKYEKIIRGGNTIAHALTHKANYQAIFNTLHEKKYPNINSLNTKQKIELLEIIFPGIKTLSYDLQHDIADVFSGTIKR